MSASAFAQAQNTTTVEFDGTVVAQCNISGSIRGAMGTNMDGTTMVSTNTAEVDFTVNTSDFKGVFGQPTLVGPNGTYTATTNNLLWSIVRPDSTVDSGPLIVNSAIPIYHGTSTVKVYGSTQKTNGDPFEEGSWTLVVPAACSQ